MIYKVGLTGGIGSGKSTVARLFAELAVSVFSADQIARELSRRGGLAYSDIIELFGNNILSDDKEIDRAALGNIVFNDDKLKKQLESILHPRIMHAMHHRAESALGLYCILDIPLLINTAERDRVDRILVVQCSQNTRFARIQKRSGWSEEKIQAVMDSQPQEQSLIDAADELIDNNHSIARLTPEVAKLHKNYTRLAKANLNR